MYIILYKYIQLEKLEKYLLDEYVRSIQYNNYEPIPNS